MARYFEDLEVGEVYELDGRYEVTGEEIKEFAEKFDPHPLHLDEEGREDSVSGSLTASSWHIASMCMRLLVDGFLDQESSMGARGVDELRSKRPVRPGDILRVEVEVLEKRDSESRPEMGHIRAEIRGYNQNNELVIRWISLGMTRKREPKP